MIFFALFYRFSLSYEMIALYFIKIIVMTFPFYELQFTLQYIPAANAILLILLVKYPQSVPKLSPSSW